MHNLTDQGLILQMRNGNEAALVELLVRYRERIYFKCMAMLDSHELSTEIVQDVFVTLWNERESLSAVPVDDSVEDTIRIFLYTIARNKCLNALKRRKSEIELEEVLLERGLGFEPDFITSLDPRVEWARKAIPKMPQPSVRKAMEEVFLKGGKLGDVSREMGITKNSLSKFLARGTKYLQKIYKIQKPIL